MMYPKEIKTMPEKEEEKDLHSPVEDMADPISDLEKERTCITQGGKEERTCTN